MHLLDLLLLSDCQSCQYRQDHNRQDALIHTRDTVNGTPELVRAKLCTTLPNFAGREVVYFILINYIN